MAKSKRKKPVKMTPRERLGFLTDKQKAHEMTIEAKRERLAKQLEYTKYSSKKTKVRFIHPN